MVRRPQRVRWHDHVLGQRFGDRQTGTGGVGLHAGRLPKRELCGWLGF
jgi:hypothetical protein